MVEIVKPLYCLIGENANRKWTKVKQLAFGNLKMSFLHPQVKKVYDQTVPLKLKCDASL